MLFHTQAVPSDGGSARTKTGRTLPRCVVLLLAVALACEASVVSADEPLASQESPATQGAPGAPAIDLTPPPEGSPQPHFALKDSAPQAAPVWRGELMHFKFEVRNTGAAPLAVRMQGCCGSQVEAPAERVIQPAQTEIFGLQVNTAGVLAEVKKQATFETNDRQNPRVTIECVARVKTGLVAEPRGITFGELPRSAEAQKQTVRLQRGDGGPIRPTIAAESAPEVRTELREVEPGERYELDVSVGPPWPNGVMRTKVVLNTGIAEAPTEEISVYAYVTPRVELIPSRFAVPQNPKEALEVSARVQWDGPPGRILDVSSSDPSIKPRIEEHEGAQTVVVPVPAGYKPAGRMTRHVVLKLDDEQVPELKIPLFITNRPQVRTPPTGPDGKVEPAAPPGEASHPAPGPPDPRKARLAPGRAGATSRPAR